ncbi:MAG: hypothetical protein WCK26_01385 [Candidatus Saccharibacteria bacterium]
MFLVGILSWWYGVGFISGVKNIKERFAISIDFFSLGLLFKTLFAPYKQISAGNVSGPIGDQMHAFFDRTVSRLVGSFVRTFMIIFGLVAMFAQAVFGVLFLFIWLVIPFLPAIGLIIMVIGWVPQWKI